MSALIRQRAMQERVIRHFGGHGTITLRRRHSLINQQTGRPLGGALTLLVNGAHNSGLSSISWRVSSGVLTGKLPKSCRFTIAGNATEYTASAEATASGNTITVAFTPALAANAADGAAVTISVAYADYTLTRMASQADVTERDTGEQQSVRVWHVAYSSSVTPAVGDLVVNGTDVQMVAEVRPVDPGGGAARWDLVMGRSA